MFRRSLTTFGLGFFATIFFLTPQGASAQVFIGGGNLFGRPTYISPYMGPANRNLYNPYGTFGTFGYPYGGYPYGGYPYSMPSSYLPGGYLSYPVTPNMTSSYSFSQQPLAYTPGIYPYALASSGTPAASPIIQPSPSLPSTGTQVPRVRPALYPAVAVTQDDDTASMQVIVPSTDAEVWFQGVKTSQTGTVREFVSPSLTPGNNYSYEVRARWTLPSGKVVNQSRTVRVRAGTRATIDFTTK